MSIWSILPTSKLMANNGHHNQDIELSWSVERILGTYLMLPTDMGTLALHCDTTLRLSFLNMNYPFHNKPSWCQQMKKLSSDEWSDYQNTGKTVLLAKKEEATGSLCAWIQTAMVTGKRLDLFGPTAALWSRIKKLAHIDKETKLIEPCNRSIPKINYLGSRKSSSSLNEILIALAITYRSNEMLGLLARISKLESAAAYSTDADDEDKNVLKLGINVTMDLSIKDRFNVQRQTKLILHPKA